MPVLLLLVGSGLLVYGAVFHVIEVHLEEEREIAILIPSPFMPDGQFGQPPYWEPEPSEQDWPLNGNPSEPNPTEGREKAETDSPFAPNKELNRDEGSENPFAAKLPNSDEQNPFEEAAAIAGMSDSSAAEDPFASPRVNSSEATGDERVPAGMTSNKITEKILVVRYEPELAIVRDVTVGGVALVLGQLKRTYSGKPPTLCPT